MRKQHLLYLLGAGAPRLTSALAAVGALRYAPRAYRSHSCLHFCTSCFPALPNTFTATRGVRCLFPFPPLLVYLQGGDGTRAASPSYPRMIAEEQEFVCVILPLFKRSVDPADPANTPPPMIIRDADGKSAGPLYKEMLRRLEETVPNLDPHRRILGGFSNGAHMTGELIDQSEGETAGQFSAFFLVEGGGRMRRYDLLKGKPLLLMYGSPKALNRIQQMHDSATAAGAKVPLHEMKGVGHAFPSEQFPAVREWLRANAQ